MAFFPLLELLWPQLACLGNGIAPILLARGSDGQEPSRATRFSHARYAALLKVSRELIGGVRIGLDRGLILTHRLRLGGVGRAGVAVTVRCGQRSEDRCLAQRLRMLEQTNFGEDILFLAVPVSIRSPLEIVVFDD